MPKNVITGRPANLLRKVQQCILAEPTQFNMDDWIRTDKKSSCGTTSCIAGWVSYLVKPKEFSTSDCSMYQLTRLAEDSIQIWGQRADTLWYVAYWPDQFHDAYHSAETPKQRAKVAAERIEHFIKTGE